MANTNVQKLRICRGIIPGEFAHSHQPDGALAGFVAADLDLAAGYIHAIHLRQVAPAGPTLDAQGCTILPGFIDVHVHGGAGFDTMDASVEALTMMARFFAQHGVTTFLPTTMTAPHPAILQAVAAVAASTGTSTWMVRALAVSTSKGPTSALNFPAHNQPSLSASPI